MALWAAKGKRAEACPLCVECDVGARCSVEGHAELDETEKGLKGEPVGDMKGEMALLPGQSSWDWDARTIAVS